MVQGTTSSAGKSLLSTALCRVAMRRGIRVAPFKAQNMSNNARAVDGGEIGCAQYLQALAAGVTPSVLHNPVLLKPEGDTRSQVVVMGQVDRSMTDSPWRGRSKRLWPIVQQAYDELAATVDLIIVEGAGSPAETNLWDDDIVNMRMAEYAQAGVVIVTDIDRGGAFAHLYGTWALLPPSQRSLIKGFILNKFRGDASLLAPAPADLETLTGVPTIGVVPMTRHHLPDEDGADPNPRSPGGRCVRVVRGPAASNLDEFWALRDSSDFAWALAPGDLRDAELIVLPGSKLVATDLAWMRAVGMDAALRDAHGRGVPIIAICGGLQALGHTIADPHGVEEAAIGLGLVPVDTAFAATKRVVATKLAFPDALDDPWRGLAGVTVTGYEIRFGETRVQPSAEVMAFGNGAGFVAGNVLGIYTHGVIEDSDVVEALVGRRPPVSLDACFDQLADLAESSIDLAVLGLG
jgi:adenosylcobyric acid synthase